MLFFPTRISSAEANGARSAAFASGGKLWSSTATTHARAAFRRSAFRAIGERPPAPTIAVDQSSRARATRSLDTIDPRYWFLLARQGYDKINRAGPREVLVNILDIEGAHDLPRRTARGCCIPEHALLTGIVIATRNGVPGQAAFRFRHRPAWATASTSCGREVIGSIRGRYFILTRQRPRRPDAEGLGRVNGGSCQPIALLARAHEIADPIAAPPRSPAAAPASRHLKLRRSVDEGAGHYDPALEGISAPPTLARRMAQPVAAKWRV